MSIHTARRRINQAAHDGRELLHLSRQGLTQLPPGIGQLNALRRMDLDDNELTALPSEIGQLKELETLDVDRNRLTALPPEIGQLNKLKYLHLGGNQLTALPPEIGQLKKLEVLQLSGNQLTALPPELGQLVRLKFLFLDGNAQLASPPAGIAKQGMAAVLAYLREQAAATTAQWVSKLLLVGEGGVGKTSLLNVLDGGECARDEETTHGIEIRTLEVPHPDDPNVTMRLNAWDFGGQEIYHATHQFFLADRSLFLLLWNARYGWEAGKLYRWLDTLQAKAPNSPVLIVATHVDERDTDLPIAALREQYPQIVEAFKVSNTTKAGVEPVRSAVAEQAAGLPLMGEPWPATWLAGADALRSCSDNAISPRDMGETMTGQGLGTDDVPRLAQYLHDLGDILHYQDDPELNDTVILKPQWVSKYISDVLECDGVVNGVLKETDMRALWQPLDTHVQDHFLRLMERFDLSYRTLKRPEISIVVERLPQNPPDYEKRWEGLAGSNSIAMRFELNSVPAGVPTYFIARSHRFTTHLHWLYGALFSDGEDPEHLALIRAFPHERYVELTVRGPYPHNFFALLRDGFELTLERFPGLKIDRLIPCPGHDGKPCDGEFKYEQLLNLLGTQPESFLIPCSATWKQVNALTLLFGLAPPTQQQVLERIEMQTAETAELTHTVLAELRALRELAQREFTRAFNRDQSTIDSHCPNVYALDPGPDGWRAVLEAVKGRKMRVQLYCQAPGEWHPVKEGRHEFAVPAGWLDAVAPYLDRMVKVLQKAAPVVQPALKVAWPEVEAVMGNDLKLMSELVKLLPTIERSREGELVRRLAETGDPERASGEALHALRQVLDVVEPDWSAQSCGGLRKLLTPEGHYLWLCDHHAREYA